MLNMQVSNLIQLKQKDLLIVKLSQAKVSLAYFIHRNKKYECANYLTFPKNQFQSGQDSTPELLASFVKEKLEKHKIQTKEIVLILDENEIFYYKVNLPFSSKIQVQKILNGEISQNTLFDTSRLQLELFEPAKTENDNYQFLVGAVLKYRLMAYVNAFHELKLNLISLSSELDLMLSSKNNNPLELRLNPEKNLAVLVQDNKVLDYFFAENLDNAKIALAFANHSDYTVQEYHSEQDVLTDYANHFAKNKKINFIHQSFLPSSQGLEKKLAALAYTLSALCLAFLLLDYSQYQSYKNQEQKLKQQLFQTYKELMPDAPPLASLPELERLAQNRLDLWQNADLGEGINLDNTSIQLLNQINTVVDPKLNISLSQLSLSASMLRINGTTNYLQNFELFRQSISTLPKLQAIQIQNTTQDAASNTISFDLLANF